MLTVIVVRRCGERDGVVVSGLIEYVLSCEDDDGFDDDYRDPESGFIVSSQPDRSWFSDENEEKQRTWEDIAGRLTTLMGSGRHITYIVDAEGIASTEFVDFIRKAVKPFEANVIDIAVKTGICKKFEKGLRI